MFIDVMIGTNSYHHQPFCIFLIMKDCESVVIINVGKRYYWLIMIILHNRIIRFAIL